MKIYLVFRSHVQQVESPNVCWDACVSSVVTKDTHSTTLRKFVFLVVQVFCKCMKMTLTLHKVLERDETARLLQFHPGEAKVPNRHEMNHE